MRFTASLVLACLVACFGLVTSAPASADTTSFTIEQAHSALASGKHTSVQLTRNYLGRIEKYEPAYNAFISMNDQALEEARAADVRRKNGKSRGVLDGVPIVVKDSLDMKGLPTTAGFWGFSAKAGGINLIPEHDSPVVARLRRAGAVIIGKTNLPELSASPTGANTSWAGPTFNVLNRHWAPGGSSTGTGAAVAADFATAGIAEESGGSIQNPAAAESLVGIKPTFGLVPNAGVVPLSGSARDSVGAIAKTTADAADMLDAIAGYTNRDPKTLASFGNLPSGGYKSEFATATLAGARIGLYGPGWRKDDELTKPTERLYQGAIATLESLGATAVPDPFAGSGFAAVAKLKEGYDPRGEESLPYDLNEWLEGLGKSARAHSLPQVEKILGVSLFDEQSPLNYHLRNGVIGWSLKHLHQAPELTPYRQARERYLRIFDRVMGEKQLDAMVFPQADAQIGMLYGGFIHSTTVSEINIAGLPAVVLPAGKYPDGKPFSLIFVGRLWSEAHLLALAHSFEEAAPGRVIRSKVATGPGPRPKQK